MGQGQPSVIIITRFGSTCVPDSALPSFKDMGQLVLEKIFLKLLPHMGKSVILVM